MLKKSGKARKLDFDYISIDQLQLWEDVNVRKTDVYTNIEELAENIGKIGVQVPLLVTPKGKNEYLVISGQRRLIASRKAGLTEVPCVITKNIESTDARIASFSENIYRLSMNDDDKSEAALKLLEKLKSEKQVAERLGVNRTTVKSYLGYALVPDRIKEFVRQHKMNRDTATKIYRKYKDNPKLMLQVAEEYANSPKSIKSAVYEAIIKANPTDNLEQIKHHIKQAKKSSPYRIRLPPASSTVVNEIAKRSGTTPADIIIQIVQKWVELFKEGKTSL